MTEPLQVVPLHARAHVLYRMYDASGALLYIGITADPEQRFRVHGIVQPWWPQVATIRLEHFSNRADVETAERAAIRSELPAHNRAHMPRATRSAEVDTAAYTPNRSIRVDDDVWALLGETYGNRSALINDWVAYLLREPGAKRPRRASAEEVRLAATRLGMADPTRR